MSILKWLSYQEIERVFRYLDDKKMNWIERSRLYDLIVVSKLQMNNNKVKMHIVESQLQKFILLNNINKKQLFAILDLNLTGILDH